MMKINALGIRGEVFNWIEDWLKDRGQRVFFRGAILNGSKLKVVFLKRLSCSSFI